LKLSSLLRNSGIDPRRIISVLRDWPRYLRDRRKFQSMLGADALPWSKELPMLTEWHESSGALGAYFHQDRHVASWIHHAKPQRHIDVGSRIDGFIGHLSVFREVEVIDIRPQLEPVQNVRFHQLDLMKELPTQWIECTDSLSCLHSIEHFGLGRYGDDIDPLGHLKGLEQLKRMVKSGGILYLSTPIGPERVEFNAHRIFAVSTLASWFSDGWKVEKFTVIDDQNRVHESLDWKSAEAENHFGCNAGIGIIAARKE
jgi:SAM-dependent methyltransferase